MLILLIQTGGFKVEKKTLRRQQINKQSNAISRLFIYLARMRIHQDISEAKCNCLMTLFNEPFRSTP